MFDVMFAVMFAVIFTVMSAVMFALCLLSFLVRHSWREIFGKTCLARHFWQDIFSVTLSFPDTLNESKWYQDKIVRVSYERNIFVLSWWESLETDFEPKHI